MTDYSPGKCNIGSQEVERRYYASLVMFLIVAGFNGIIFYFPRSAVYTYTYISLFFIAISASIIYLQYRNSFCTGLALWGKQKTGENAEKVGSSEDVRKDRKKAFVMFAQSVLFSAVLTGLTYLAVNYIGFIPVLS